MIPDKSRACKRRPAMTATTVIDLQHYRRTRTIREAEPPKPKPKLPYHVRIAGWCLDEIADGDFPVSERELRFLHDMERWPKPPTERQTKWLEAITFRIEVENCKPKKPTPNSGGDPAPAA